MSRWVVVLCGLVLAGTALPASADAVVGTGSPASCNEAALDAAVNTVVPNGGTIRFNCGGAATINITSQKIFYRPDRPTLVYGIDGGGLITLNGQGLTRHIFHLSGTLNVSNITFTGGHAVGVGDEGSGGAIRTDRNPPQVPTAVGLNLSNVTFTNNVAQVTAPNPGLYVLDSGGGAVFVRSSFATIVNCVFSGNVCNNCSGGGLHGRSSGMTVNACVFNGNSSNGGGLAGALHVDGVTPAGSAPNGSLQLLNSIFTNNTALNEGGAIFLFFHAGAGESGVLDGLNVVGNRVIDSGRVDFVGNNGFGGGICTNNGSITIRNSTISGNTARGTISANGPGIGGGAAITSSDAVTITNSTFSANRAFGGNGTALGGGLLILGNAQPFRITHSTVTLNQSDAFGGGIHSQTSGVLVNTIFANNTAPTGPQCFSQLTNGGGALQFPDSSPRCASALTVANPQLGALASNGGFTQTHHPLAGSPAINAVPCAAATDQRGVARPQGSNCEIGSVEVACSVALNPLTLPTGRVGTAYSQTIAASGGASPGLALTGTLPSGITFNASSGLLSGTPSQSGNFVITVTATDSFGCAAARTYNLTIASTTAVNPFALSVDAAGNRVLEPNQTVVVAPSWTNQTGGGVTLTGTASSFIGPAGATYSIVDGSASYGTVTPGATASCSTGGNCYSMSIAAGARPASHWDGSFVESLSTGGPKSWTLHVGGSFTDVPSSSGYYRDVETLLHRGITGGCGASTYCPANSTTRDQMAVFVLVAKEGPGYTPPACSPPNTFGDVPETSPYCRWIEELARRGVVSGCGGGNYCPGTAVARDQMAIFVLVTLDPALNPPACSPPNTFADVPETSPYCRWIEELARRGVVGGCGGGNYCPSSPVTREQMGVFLSATFGLTLYGP